MAKGSSIEWTGSTWNPITGCQKVSPGCDNCYAERITNRFNRGPFSTVIFHEDRLKIPASWKKPDTIFVCSMSDLFNSNVSNEQIEQVWLAMLSSPQHTYQLLTKRPNRVARWWRWFSDPQRRAIMYFTPSAAVWPENIWLGTSIESPKFISRIQRIKDLAPVTFISAEPLLGPLLDGLDNAGRQHHLGGGVDWVIAGGESGPGHRHVHAAWVREIRDACVEFDIPFFFKQWGGNNPSAGGRELDGREWNEMPVPPSKRDCCGYHDSVECRSFGRCCSRCKVRASEVWPA